MHWRGLCFSIVSANSEVGLAAIITVLSNFGGWLPRHLMSRGWSVTRARKTSMFIFALCVVPIIFVTSVGNWMAVFLIGLAGSV
jgi:ACS family hexuronate transporter-like MFS transporter